MFLYSALIGFGVGVAAGTYADLGIEYILVTAVIAAALFFIP